MKHLSILGSTGSIGRNTLEIVARFPDAFKAVALTAKHGVEALAGQIRQFRPELAVVYNETDAEALERLLTERPRPRILYGPDGYRAAATWDKANMVVSAMVGAAGLVPTLAALENGKDVALANKETLVAGGAIVMPAVKAAGVRLLPVDSEHNAIFQCLQGSRRADLEKIYLTASGGPFRTRPLETFAGITVADALAHPNWDMGAKISIDSATMMNKGLEVIEAAWLFDLMPAQIEIVVHPQSIVHSMVGYRDGSVIAQMGQPDMKTAIAYALHYPRRLHLKAPLPDFKTLARLDFEAPDFEKFPCLRLAFKALQTGQTLPAVMNAANEAAVAAFLDGKISFTTIAALVEKTMTDHDLSTALTFDAIVSADAWAREFVCHQISLSKNTRTLS